jgi:hypothetical protein
LTTTPRFAEELTRIQARLDLQIYQLIINVVYAIARHRQLRSSTILDKLEVGIIPADFVVGRLDTVHKGVR